VDRVSKALSLRRIGGDLLEKAARWFDEERLRVQCLQVIIDVRVVGCAEVPSFSSSNVMFLFEGVA
jgi:hypothetical protein